MFDLSGKTEHKKNNLEYLLKRSDARGERLLE